MILDVVASSTFQADLEHMLGMDVTISRISSGMGTRPSVSTPSPPLSWLGHPAGRIVTDGATSSPAFSSLATICLAGGLVLLFIGAIGAAAARARLKRVARVSRPAGEPAAAEAAAEAGLEEAEAHAEQVEAQSERARLEALTQRRQASFQIESKQETEEEAIPQHRGRGVVWLRRLPAEVLAEALRTNPAEKAASVGAPAQMPPTTSGSLPYTEVASSTPNNSSMHVHVRVHAHVRLASQCAHGRL